MSEKILDEWWSRDRSFRLRVIEPETSDSIPSLWIKEKTDAPGARWRRVVPDAGVPLAVFARLAEILEEAEKKGLLKKEYPTRDEAIKEALGKMNPALAAMVDTSNALLVEFSTGVPALWPGGCEPAQEHFANKAMWQAWVAGEGR